MPKTAAPLVHKTGDGESNDAFGIKRWFRITPDDTDGAFAIFEEDVPEGVGPPLHIHHDEIEVFTVLSGSVRFHCNGHELVAEAGATVMIPAGSRHTFQGVGPGSSRILVMLSPGKGEGFFRDVETQGLSPREDMEAIGALGRDYGVTFVGPPLS